MAGNTKPNTPTARGNYLAATLIAMAGQEGVISVPRAFVRFTGDFATALVLNEFLFWQPKATRSDGYFYKSDRELMEKLELKRYSVRKATAALLDMDIIETDKFRVMGAPTLHYRLKMDVLHAKWIAWLESEETRLSENEQSDCPKSDNRPDCANPDNHDCSDSDNPCLSENGQSLTESDSESDQKHGMAAADAPRPRIAPLTAPPEVVLPGAQPSQPALFAMEIAPTPPPTRTADSGKESPAGKRQAGKNGRQPAEARPAAAGSVEEMVGDFLNACRRPDQTNPEYVIPYSLNQGEERAAARKLLDDGWTSAQVVQCLYYLKGLRDRNGDPLYTTHINLWTIRKQIGAWFAKQNKAQRQAAKRQEDEIVPLVQRAAR